MTRFTIVERTILERLCHGAALKQIARELDIGQRTLERRLQIMREHIGAKSTLELIFAYAKAV